MGALIAIPVPSQVKTVDSERLDHRRQSLSALAARANGLRSHRLGASDRGAIHERLNDIVLATREPFDAAHPLGQDGLPKVAAQRAALEEWERRLSELLDQASFYRPDIAAVAALLDEHPLRQEGWVQGRQAVARQ